MKVVIVDLGSRLNKVGGQARIAAILYRGLKRFFDTYYVGYETEYLGGDKNTVLLERGTVLSLSLRKNRFSENWALRLGYNLVVVRNLLGIGMNRGELLQKMRAIRPDVVVANSVQDIVLLKYLKRNGLEFKTVYIDHNSISTSIASGYLSKEAMPLTIGCGITAYSVADAKRKFFNFFDVNVALSPAQFNSIKALTNKVTVILNGIDVKIAKNADALSRLRLKYGFKSNNFVVLYVGRLFERQKNISTLIKAFKTIDNRNIRLLIVGDGPSRQEYTKLAKDDNRIVFTGNIEDRLMSYIYRLADLFVLPSFWEAGLSLTALEAAANSLPIILSKNVYVAGLRDSEVGEVLSFNTNSKEDLANKISLVYKSKKIRDYAVLVSKKLARKFNENSMLLQYRDLILKPKT